MKTEQKIILITGATSGIGRVAAGMFAKKGFNLILPVRDIKQGEIIRSEISKVASSSKVDVFLCDFSSLASVRNFAQEVQRHYPRLDVLVNNAGVFPQERTVSLDGYELNFAVNYLAPTLLTYELLDLLKKSAPSRIINVASSMYREGVIDLNDLQGMHFNRYKAYAQSKLAIILFTKGLAKELKGTKVSVNALHPGVVKTKLAMKPLAFSHPILRAIFKMKMKSPQEGADRIVYLATSSDVEGVTGEYFEKDKPVNLINNMPNESTMDHLAVETRKMLALTK